MRSLKEIGCSVVEIGHAERRKNFGETGEVVGLKVRAAIRNGLIPIICIGEPRETSLEGTIKVLRNQLEEIYSVTSSSDTIILAYEPLWAIGQPVPASSSYIVSVGKALRAVVKEEGRRESVKVLYGGSAKPGLWREIEDGVDGMFLGRFAHEVGNVEVIMGEMTGATGVET